MKKHNIREYRELIQFLRGSGKTSLVNLISRLYDVTEGTVKIFVNELIKEGYLIKEYDYIEIFKNKKGIEKFADKVYTVNEPGLTWDI